MVQCSPVQPWWQSHLPSRQTPWSMQRGWQSLCSHSGPVQPSSHWHTPPMQDPWGPQSTTQTSVVREKPGRRVTSALVFLPRSRFVLCRCSYLSSAGPSCLLSVKLPSFSWNHTKHKLWQYILTHFEFSAIWNLFFSSANISLLPEINQFRGKKQWLLNNNKMDSFSQSPESIFIWQ